ncbi:MAG: phosphatidylglycerophosphatase A [Litorivicinus sp.]
MALTPSHPVHWLAVGLGSGLPRVAPGTWGTLGGVVAFLPALWLTEIWVYIWVLLGALVGPYICGKTATDLKCGDHGSIVWDEWAGVWIALAASIVVAPDSWWGWLFAFVFFRFFDIFKPWPIHRLERLKPIGLGIMADDLGAGVAAAGCVIVLAQLGLI